MSLKLLRELTESLSWKPCQESAKSYIEVDTVEGHSFLFNAYNDGLVAVSRVFMSAGTRYAPHAHDQIEHLIVYKGCMHITIDGVVHTIEEGECFTMRPGTEHSSYVEVDTWSIAITIPAAHEFPK